jgi:hypothetical protein
MSGARLMTAVIAVLLGLPVLAAAQPAAIYEKGAIEVRPDPGFGQGTDWAAFIENEFNGVAVAPDGSVFLAQQRAHRIHKFDRSGRLVKSFGRQGQGPGDFQFPQHLSILDGRYLIVGENAEGRRISLFDLDGQFVKLVKTGQGPFGVLALRDGIVAYLAKSFPRKGSLVLQESSAVLLDTNTEKEVTVCGHALFTDEDQVYASPGGAPPQGKFGRGEMIINRTAGGDLVVGHTSSPKIFIFSPAGRPVREITLDYSPLEWNDGLWRRYKDAQIETALANRPNDDPAKVRKRFEDLPRLSEYLPYFSEILTDADGRLLVVRRGDCFRRCDPVLRVFAPDGGLVGQTTLRGGDFEVEIDRRFRNLVFAADGLYGVLLVRDSPDDERRLVRVKF